MRGECFILKVAYIFSVDICASHKGFRIRKGKVLLGSLWNMSTMAGKLSCIY